MNRYVCQPNSLKLPLIIDTFELECSLPINEVEAKVICERLNSGDLLKKMLIWHPLTISEQSILENER